MSLQLIALVAFLFTILLVLWRPAGLHEAVPALLGASIMFVVGLIDGDDVLRVIHVVGNSGTTIIATFVMASVLEGAGFFRWVTGRLIENANGSKRRLFHLCLAFMTCLTLFLNNDGAILLGMPVILRLVQQVRISGRDRFLFLIGSGLIASAASTIIGVSNIANLEAMALVGISLIEHVREIAFPGLVGICSCWWLLAQMLESEQGSRPLCQAERSLRLETHRDLPWMIRICLGVIVLVRAGFFIASALHIPNSLVAVVGAAVMLSLNTLSPVVDPRESLRKAPWAVLGFAFGLDLMVFGLRNAQITGMLTNWVGPYLRGSVSGISFLPGALVAMLASSLNNHPALIVGSLTLLDVTGLSKQALNIAYAGVVLGSDLGGLLTPVGTLASLLWFHIVQQHGLRYTWSDYLRVTCLVIPVGFVLALCGLYLQALLTAG